ncbi:Malectin-like domain [Dillenia turbinata]|uniref:Malectin-like domain n=1 Tax=Dillenia turbinata TaxID=194707 RepID=A0AAN8Z7B6_9MAGN
MRWWSDERFITTGKNKLINPKINIPGAMTTLRYFPKGDQNCYELPLSTSYKFLIRAGFYYGNYDGKFKPPVFNLTLGGEYWTTVDTSSSDEPISYEAIYAPKNKSLSVCLIRSQDGGVPFISSLEASGLIDNSRPSKYAMMGNNAALELVSRVHFGSHDQIIGPWPTVSCEEYFGRVWMPKSIPDYPNNYYDMDGCYTSYFENEPPSLVMKTSISAPNSSSSITFPVNFMTDTPQTAYFVFYFYDSTILANSTDTRIMEIFINGVPKNVTQVNFYHRAQVVSVYPVAVKGIANVTISPYKNSTLPPILNGMEVFTSKELIEQPTSSGLKLYASFSSALSSLHIVEKRWAKEKASLSQKSMS